MRRLPLARGLEPDRARGGARAGVPEDHKTKVGGPDAADRGDRGQGAGAGAGAGRHRQDLPRHRQGGGSAGERQGGAHRALATGGGGRRVDRLPARRDGGQARAVPAAALRRALRPALDEAGARADGRGRHRDRPGRLHARAHPQQRLRGDRRGAELHLRAAEDAADPAGLVVDHGDHRRPRTSPTCWPSSRAWRRWRRGWRRCRNVAVVRLADADIVRHPLVGEMLAVL